MIDVILALYLVADRGHGVIHGVGGADYQIHLAYVIRQAAQGVVYSLARHSVLILSVRAFGTGQDTGTLYDPV